MESQVKWDSVFICSVHLISSAFLKLCLMILPRLIGKVRSRRMIGRPQFLPDRESLMKLFEAGDMNMRMISMSIKVSSCQRSLRSAQSAHFLELFIRE